MIYTVTLNPAIDYHMNLASALDPSDINISSHEYLSIGGKGINVSKALKFLGKDSIVLGFAGGFTGDMLKDALRKLDIKEELTPIEQGMTRINVKISSSITNECQLNSQGPAITDSEVEAFADNLRRIKKGDILALCGSIPKSLSKTFYRTIIEKTNNPDIDIVVDATGDALISTLDYRPLLIKPNIYELEEVTGKSLDTEAKRIEACQSLIEQGARSVLLSLGEEGAIYVTPDTVIKKEAPKVDIISTIGAGDSMLGGFLSAYTDHRSPESCLNEAIKTASLAISGKL